ncbi:beta-1,4-galactosyltransferase 1 isoform X2 [Ictalurus furcatus]|uniref:beta-1,4-galactosyltransferase 1 isoform X2 n=1 Tax=Ictalurus furcatus TaxID=66913 RepID=UPI00234FDCBA|nr:beta-1,4-galactosyltransferase 1 isoform X2 [Ictalurus furcatus]
MREFPRCLLNRRCTLLVVVCLLAVMFFYMLHFDTSRVKTLPFTRYRELTSVPVTSARNDSVPSARNDSVPTVDTQSNQLQQYCPETPPKLDGPLYVDFSEPVKLDSLLKDSRLSLGGRFMPSECVSQQRVALIIPFRDRELHLKIWLFYMHPILQRQQIDYGIYIIEQDGEETFNRAKLLNVGYVESLKEYDYNCFVFSDVDLIPTDDRNLYKCYDQPRHLSVAMDKFGFNLTLQGMSISRPDHNIGRCKMIRHARDKLNQPNPHRFSRIARTKQTMETDGINSLNYNVVGWEKTRLYTKIIVDIGKPPSL